MDRKTPTYGGYSSRIVVDERFTLRIPAGLDLAGAAPLLCAGITTFSPLRHWNAKPGDRVGVVGLGGLGHMAVKLAASMGAEVTMLSTSPRKEADARRLGAHGFALTSDPATFKKLAGRFDLIIDTISAPHDYNAYLGMLRVDGAMVLVGVPPAAGAGRTPSPSSAAARRSPARSSAASPRRRRCSTSAPSTAIVSDVEVIPIQKINEAYDRMLKSDVRYRFSSTSRRCSAPDARPVARVARRARPTASPRRRSPARRPL